MTFHGKGLRRSVFWAATTITLAMATLMSPACVDWDGTGLGVDLPPLGFSGITVEPSLPDIPPPGGMISPLRITTTPNGRLLVADASRRMVLALDPGSLQPQGALAIQGKPSGLALLGSWILVSNRSDQRVDVYSSEGGAYQRSFGQGQLSDPADLAVDRAQGLVFVADSRLGQVLVFDWEGTFLHAISSKGSAPGQLQTPIGIAADSSTEEVVVSDWGAWGSSGGATASVQVFGYDGTHKATISGKGDCGMLGCSGGFSRPHGIVVSGGKIYVPDLILAQVLVFDRASLVPMGAVGGRPRLRLPSHVAIIGGEDLFVVSNGTASVEAIPGGAG